MDITQVIPQNHTPADAPHGTVGQLRKKYGEHFAEGYEDTDPINAVLGRAGMATLGEYLRLHVPSTS